MPPIEAAMLRASSGVSATWPGSTGSPKRANSSFAWYSCRFMGASVVVDLGALQVAAEIHVDALPLGERVEHGVTGLTVAVAGATGAAERQVGIGAGGAVVHVHDPGVEVAHRAEGAVHIGGEDRGREPVGGGVVDLDRVLQALHLEHRQHRPEDLLDRDPGAA